MSERDFISEFVDNYEREKLKPQPEPTPWDKVAEVEAERDANTCGRCGRTDTEWYELDGVPYLWCQVCQDDAAPLEAKVPAVDLDKAREKFMRGEPLSSDEIKAISGLSEGAKPAAPKPAAPPAPPIPTIPASQAVPTYSKDCPDEPHTHLYGCIERDCVEYEKRQQLRAAVTGAMQAVQAAAANDGFVEPTYQEVDEDGGVYLEAESAPRTFQVMVIDESTGLVVSHQRVDISYYDDDDPGWTDTRKALSLAAQP